MNALEPVSRFPGPRRSRRRAARSARLLLVAASALCACLLPVLHQAELAAQPPQAAPSPPGAAPPATEAAAADSAAQRPPRLDAEAARAKLKALEAVVLPEASFDGTPLAEALASLERKGAELDPAEGGGLRLSLAPELDAGAGIHLRLNQVPWSEVLRYLATSASARVAEGEGGMLLVPATAKSEPEFTIVLHDIVPAKTRSVEALRAGGQSIMKAMEQAGIAMPLGSSAVYNPDAKQLIVRHTEEGHALVRAWLEALP